MVQQQIYKAEPERYQNAWSVSEASPSKGQEQAVSGYRAGCEMRLCSQCLRHEQRGPRRLHLLCPLQEKKTPARTIAPCIGVDHFISRPAALHEQLYRIVYTRRESFNAFSFRHYGLDKTKLRKRVTPSWPLCCCDETLFDSRMLLRIRSSGCVSLDKGEASG